jgi:pilus assembly protein FimV
MAIGAGSLLLLLVVMLIAKRRKESDSADEWDKAQHQVNNDDEGLVAVQPTVDIDNKLVADMLVAYADYEKAMALLEQAQQQEASDQLVLSKLLYVMFKQQQTEPFVTLASGLNIDKDSPEWSEIAAWGRQLAPLNTLFHLATDDSEPASDLTFDSFSEVKDDELFAESISAPEVDEIEDNVPNTIEFNLDDYDTEELVSTADTVIAVPDEINNNDESLTFDTSFSLNNEDENPDFDTPLNFESDSDDDELSLNNEPLSLDLTEGTYQADLLGTDENLQDLEPENSDFEFDISGYDEIDEAETKLDLASAYADMGDPNGARNILEEVLKEGNAEQKSKAQALLKNLS